MPPSRACSQLHSSITFDTWRCVAGICVHSNSGSGGMFSRPHISPDDPTQFDGGVGCGAHFMGETAIRRLVHLVDTGAGHVELPAVIDTA